MKSWLIYSILLVLICQIYCREFNVNVKNDGSYSIEVNNQTWLNSANTFMRAHGFQYDQNSESLVLQKVLNSQGSDVLGTWKAVTFVYSVFNDSELTMNCNILKYDNLDLVRFIQEFPKGAKGTAVPNTYQSVSSGFPTFKLEKSESHTLGFLSYGGMMAGNMQKLFGSFNDNFLIMNDGISGGPLVLFNTRDDALVISPMNEFMSASSKQSITERTLSFGVMSGVDEYPKEYACDFIVYYSANGINKAMEGWGKQLQIFHNKDLSYRKNDITQNYLSYWTDNGAYYYFHTEKNKTYEQTVFDIIDHAKNLSIPYKTFQYDSWWYNRRYVKGALIWDGNVPTPSFPDSMEYAYKVHKMPITGHNKFWDAKATYAKENGGGYDFIIDHKNYKSLPNDETFFDDLFKNASRWGLKTYEQDWMDTQSLAFDPLNTNLTLGRKWLNDMGKAALKHGMTIQYCMSLSRHILQSLENSAVTQARVTNDYDTNWNYRGGEQWRLGVSSIFSAAVGLAPFKDVFWSTSVQPGNTNGNRKDGSAYEAYPALNAVTASLAGGPVGPGDKIGYMNKTLIMRSCNEEGLLLKSTKPVTAVDQHIHFKAFGKEFGIEGEVNSAYSLISNLTFGMLLAADVGDSYEMNSTNIGFKFNDASYFWEDKSNEKIVEYNKQIQENKLIIDKSCTKSEFCLYHITPIITINGYKLGIIGEQSKWVAVSPQRVLSIEQTTDSLQIYLQGGVDERIEFSLLINGSLKKAQCNFNPTGSAKIVVDLSTQVTLTCN